MKAVRLIAAACLYAHLPGAGAAEVDIPGDDASLRRGGQVVMEICRGCHSLKYLKYRDLVALGIPKAQVDAWRGDAAEGAIHSLTPPEASRAAFGVEPPDLSLMAKAREGGPRYVYDLLTGYVVGPDGNVTNKVFAGVRMPDVLGVSTAQGEQRAAVAGQARDAAAFLRWAADPRSRDRARVGTGVLIYLVVLTALLYLIKRRVWSRLPPPEPEGQPLHRTGADIHRS